MSKFSEFFKKASDAEANVTALAAELVQMNEALNAKLTKLETDSGDQLKAIGDLQAKLDSANAQTAEEKAAAEKAQADAEQAKADAAAAVKAAEEKATAEAQAEATRIATSQGASAPLPVAASLTVKENVTRAEFNAMSPKDQMKFIKNGGRLN